MSSKPSRMRKLYCSKVQIFQLRKVTPVTRPSSETQLRNFVNHQEWKIQEFYELEFTPVLTFSNKISKRQKQSNFFGGIECITLSQRHKGSTVDLSNKIYSDFGSKSNFLRKSLFQCSQIKPEICASLCIHSFSKCLPAGLFETILLSSRLDLICISVQRF